MIRQKKLPKKTACRILLFIVLFISYSVTGNSQDKIITITKDTIDCKITRITRNTIFFDLITNSVKTSGSLPVSKVINYTISATGVTADKPKPLSSNSFERFRLGINGGAGYLLASSEKAEEALADQGLGADKAKSYYRDLKTGWTANADLTYMITPAVGTGIKYKFFYTSGNVEGYFDFQDGVHIIYANFGERIFVNYYSSVIYYQEYLGRSESVRLTSAYSVGLATYRNEIESFNGYYNVLMKGKCFGTDATLGLEYFFTNNLSIGADLSVFLATLRKVTRSEGLVKETIELDKENYENLSRLEFSLGIRLYFWNK